MSIKTHIDVKAQLFTDYYEYYASHIDSFVLIIDRSGKIQHFSENSVLFFDDKIKTGTQVLEDFISPVNWKIIQAMLRKNTVGNKPVVMEHLIGNEQYSVSLYTKDNESYLLTFNRIVEPVINTADLYNDIIINMKFPCALVTDGKITANNGYFERVFNTGFADIEAFYSFIDQHGSSDELKRSGEVTIGFDGGRYAIAHQMVSDGYSIITVVKSAVEKVVAESVQQAGIEEITRLKTEYQSKIDTLTVKLKSQEELLQTGIAEINFTDEKIKSIKTTTIVTDITSLQEEYEKVLSYTSENLNKMTELSQFIEDISTKIHLISINAAIESARVGDMGKGFSVISKEIAKLSDDTQNYTKMIIGQIDNIISFTNTINIQDKHIIDKIKSSINELAAGYEKILGISSGLKKAIM